jgi:hypothetical protein
VLYVHFSSHESHSGTCPRPTLKATANFNGIAIIGALLFEVDWALLDDLLFRRGCVHSGSQRGGVVCAREQFLQASSFPLFYLFIFEPSRSYRSVRNLVLDTTNIPASQVGTGLHWQVRSFVTHGERYVIYPHVTGGPGDIPHKCPRRDVSSGRKSTSRVC